MFQMKQGFVFEERIATPEGWEKIGELGQLPTNKFVGLSDLK